MSTNKTKQQGLGLVEIMVSLAIGLFILAGVIQMFLTGYQNSSLVRGNSAIQEHVRLLFSHIENDIANAGYAGCLNFKANAGRIFNIATQTETPAFTMDRFITGESNVGVNGRNFDEFTVRYAGSKGRARVLEVEEDSFKVDASTSSIFHQGDYAVAGDCSSVGIFRVSNNPGDSGLIKFEEGTYNTGTLDVEFPDSNDLLPGVTYVYGGSGAHRYYVETSSAANLKGSTCSDATPENCALYRKSSNSGAADELVEGVESFEVEYGWRDAASGDLFFANAGVIPAATWPEIDRVRVTTTLSSQHKTPTAEGIDYLEKSFSRTFFFFNQIPEV